MKLRLLSASDLANVLPMETAIEAMREAYAELSSGQAVVPQRLAIPVEDAAGTALVKPALTADGLGAKLVSVYPRNRQRNLEVTAGLMVLLDRSTGHPQGLCDGTYLTALRTGAATGVATDLLARADARRAALFGCGGQAATQLLALETVRELSVVRVYARTGEAVKAFVEKMQPRLRLRLEAAASSAEAIDGAEVICTATTSSTPVFDGRHLDRGTHVNGIGSFTPGMREIDEETIRRARVFVDSRSAARSEAGELIAAERAGLTRPEDWTELGEVVMGDAQGRCSADEITFFKSVGSAVQDVKAATVAFERAREVGVGTMVDL